MHYTFPGPLRCIRFVALLEGHIPGWLMLGSSEGRYMDKPPVGQKATNWRSHSDEQPGPPTGGLPGQPTPRWLALLCKLSVFPFMAMDLAIQALIRRLQPPPYELKGNCKMRGNCCHYIFMEWPPILDKWPWFGKFWLWWYTDVHGFYQRGFEFENDDGRIAKVMSCRHLQSDGRCGSYRLRPAICRQWPRHSYTSQPHILKGCGYFAIPRDQSPQGPTTEQSESSTPPPSSNQQ